MGVPCEVGCTCRRHRGKIFTADTYQYNHSRVKKERGRAAEYTCVRCDRSAENWAQVHDSTGTDPWGDFMPLCMVCHNAYDEVGKRQEGREVPEEWRLRISAAARGRKASPETRAKLSAASTTKGKKRPPEVVAKISATLKGHSVSAEARAKQSATMKQRHADKISKLLEEMTSDDSGGIHPDEYRQPGQQSALTS